MNETIKKIIDNDFKMCGSTIRGDDCKLCPLRGTSPCHNYPEEKRQAVIEHIAKELADAGPVVRGGGWNREQKKIIAFYSPDTTMINFQKHDYWEEIIHTAESLRINKYKQFCGRLSRTSIVKNKQYYVFSPQGNSPTVKHDSYESALTEAKRLIAMPHNANREFYVCEIKAYLKNEINVKLEEF